MQSFTANPFPALYTERLHLRQLRLTNENEIFALRNNKQVNEFINRPLVTSVAEARDFIIAINEGITDLKWL